MEVFAPISTLMDTGREPAVFLNYMQTQAHGHMGCPAAKTGISVDTDIHRNDALKTRFFSPFRPCRADESWNLWRAEIQCTE